MQSGAERSEDQASTNTFAGVSLVQLASVAAARAEGFSLEQILNAEGLEAEAYRAADIEYKRRLVEPDERDRLAANYTQELARAEDRLGRKVSPLDDDIEAWVRFLGAYGTQSAPAEWLVTLGLIPPDLSRLSRNWKQRLDADEGLRKKAEKSAREKKPYDASSLSVVPAKLVPSPLAKRLEKAAMEEPGAIADEAPKQVKRWMPRNEAPVDATPAPAMTSSEFSGALPLGSSSVLPDEPPMLQEATSSRDALSGTSLSVDIPRGQVTPFAKSPDALEVRPQQVVLNKPTFVPKLSLEHHAAMTVELATYPAHTLAILQRYGLTPPEKVDLDQHYQRVVANDPGKQAAWHAAYGAHYRTLMQAHQR